MASLVIPQGVVVRLIWQQSTVDYAVNVLGAQNSTSLSITQALTNTIGAAVKASLASSGLAARLSNTVNLKQVGLRDINTANRPEFLDAAAGASGTQVADVLPGNVAYCATIRTALAGRSFRGRYYQFGLTELDNTLGAPTATVLTTTAAFVNAIGAALSGNGLTPAVLSRVHLVATPWAGAVARSTTWATQRRRLIPGI